MNKTILMGRLTKDPEVKYLQDKNSTAMARYTLAVDRRYRKDGKAETDFISCVTFGKNAEFVEKYLQKGLKILVSGRIQTGSYVNQEGNKVYTINVIVEEHYFAEGKKLSGSEKKEDTVTEKMEELKEEEKNDMAKKKTFEEYTQEALYEIEKTEAALKQAKLEKEQAEHRIQRSLNYLDTQKKKKRKARTHLPVPPIEPVQNWNVRIMEK